MTCVTTQLLEEGEDDSHTPELGTWEFAKTPKTLEFDCKGQNTFHWHVPYIIGKLSKCKCRKWARTSRLDICSTRYDQKKRPGVKLVVWLPTIKSRELTRPRCMQVDCDTSLKSYRQEIQVCFRPHPNRSSEQRVITLQSGGNPNQDSFRTPPWESRNKKPFGCRCCGEAQKILYGGRWWLPPNPGCDESYESKVARGLS
jgi:hypothetical protein